MTPGRNHPVNSQDIIITNTSFISIANTTDMRLNIKPHILIATASLGGFPSMSPRSTTHRAAAITYRNNQASIMIIWYYSSSP